jgi:hypothetical protein
MIHLLPISTTRVSFICFRLLHTILNGLQLNLFMCMPPCPAVFVLQRLIGPITGIASSFPKARSSELCRSALPGAYRP